MGVHTWRASEDVAGCKSCKPEEGSSCTGCSVQQGQEACSTDLVHWRRPRIAPELNRKLVSIWRGPFTVTEKLGDVNYRLMDKHGVIADTPAHAGDLMVVNGERP